MHTEEKNGLIEQFCSGSGARSVPLCEQIMWSGFCRRGQITGEYQTGCSPFVPIWQKRENKNGWKQRGGSMVAAPKSCLSHPLSASTPIITQLCQEFLASAILWHTFLYIFSEINSPIHPIPSCHIGLRVPNCYRSISTYLEVPQRTSKYPEVPQSTSKYLKTQEITQCTPKYLEIPLST